MNVTVDSHVLKKQLQTISRVLAPNPIYPILEDFLFIVDNGTLEVIASDLDISMRARLDVEADTDGRIAIPSKILMDTLAQLPRETITFQIDLEKSFVQINTSFGEYQIVGDSAEDFPKVPEPDEVNTFTLSSSQLTEAIQKTLFATGRDTLRTVFTGVLMEFEPGVVNFVATDAQKLSRYTIKEELLELKTAFVVPAKGLKVLQRALVNNHGAVQIAYDKARVFFSFQRQEIACQLIDEKYPDYRSVFPKEKGGTMTIQRGDLLNSLKRLSVFCNKNTNQITFNIKLDALTIEARDKDKSNKGKESLSCSYEKEAMQISFNVNTLLNMLQVLDEGKVHLEMTKANRPGVFTMDDPPKGEDVTMLVMPIQGG